MEGIRTRSAGATLRWMSLITPENAAVYSASSPVMGTEHCACSAGSSSPAGCSGSVIPDVLSTRSCSAHAGHAHEAA